MVSGSVHKREFSSQGLFVGFGIFVTATHKEESKQKALRPFISQLET